MNTRLTKELSELPQAHGVYYFYGPENNLLYIGKAINHRGHLHIW